MLSIAGAWERWAAVVCMQALIVGSTSWDSSACVQGVLEYNYPLYQRNIYCGKQKICCGDKKRQDAHLNTYWWHDKQRHQAARRR